MRVAPLASRRSGWLASMPVSTMPTTTPLPVPANGEPLPRERGSVGRDAVQPRRRHRAPGAAPARSRSAASGCAATKRGSSAGAKPNRGETRRQREQPERARIGPGGSSSTSGSLPDASESGWRRGARWARSADELGIEARSRRDARRSVGDGDERRGDQQAGDAKRSAPLQLTPVARGASWAAALRPWPRSARSACAISARSRSVGITSSMTSSAASSVDVDVGAVLVAQLLDVGLSLRALGHLLDLVVVDRVHGRLRPHHRDGRGGQRDARVGLEGRAAHGVEARAVRLAHDDGDLRHGRLADRGDHLGAGADDALPLHLGADHEAGHVRQVEQRDVERVAEPDEPRRLVRAVDEEHAAQVLRLVGDDAHHAPFDAREPGDDLLREELLDLDESCPRR